MFGSASTVPFPIECVLIFLALLAGVLVAGIAGVAVLHPDADVRAGALRVLRVLLDFLLVLIRGRR